MGQGPETRLVNRMRAAILAEYPTAWIIKTHGSPFQQAGLPDLIVVVGGRVAGIEAKAQRPGESREAAFARVTMQQKACMVAMERAGAVTGVAVSVEDALAVMARL